MADATQSGTQDVVESNPRVKNIPALQRSTSTYSLIMTKQERKKWKQFNKSKQQCIKTLHHYNDTINKQNEDNNNNDNNNNNKIENIYHNPFVSELEGINKVLDSINLSFFDNYSHIMDGFQQTETDCTNEWKDEDDVDTSSESENDDTNNNNNSSNNNNIETQHTKKHNKKENNNDSGKAALDTIKVMNDDIIDLNKLNAFLNNYEKSVHRNLKQFKENLLKVKQMLEPKPIAQQQAPSQQQVSEKELEKIDEKQEAATTTAANKNEKENEIDEAAIPPMEVNNNNNDNNNINDEKEKEMEKDKDAENNNNNDDDGDNEDDDEIEDDDEVDNNQDNENDENNENNERKDEENENKKDDNSDVTTENINANANVKVELKFDENANLFANEETEKYKRELSIERANVQTLKDIIIELQSELGRRGALNARVLNRVNHIVNIGNYNNNRNSNNDNDDESKEYETQRQSQSQSQSQDNILHVNNTRESSVSDEGFDCEIVSMEHPGDIYPNSGSTIGWNLRNIGKHPFDDNIKLGFICGDGLLISSYTIPKAKIGETIFIKVNFYSFSKPGVYETVFRLTHNGLYFGPSLHIKFRVITATPGGPYDAPPILYPKHLPNMKPDSPSHTLQQQKQQQQQNNSSNNGNGMRQKPMKPNAIPPTRSPHGHRHAHHRPPNAAPTRQSARMMTRGSSNGSSDDGVTTTTGTSTATVPKPVKLGVSSEGLNCLCGSELMIMEVTQAYNGKKVYCDICRKQCQGIVFHCPKGDSKDHRGGFDLCSNCSSVQPVAM